MATWNPNTPGSYGLEFIPTSVGSLPLAADTDAIAVAFTALTTRNISAIDLMATVQVSGVLCIDLYTEVNYLVAPVGDSVSTASSAPTADISQAGWLTALPHWSQLVGDPYVHDANFITSIYAAATYERDRFGSLSVAAGNRVLNMRMAAYVILAAYGGLTPPPVGVRLFLDDLATTQSTFNPLPMPVVAGGLPVYLGETKVNPQTKAPWQRSEIATWTAGATFGTEAYAGPDAQLRLNNHRVYADFATERRLAWATPAVAASPTIQRIQSGSLILASTGAAGSPTLTAGQRYVIVLHRAPQPPAYWGGAATPTAAVLTVPLVTPTPPLVGYSVSTPPLDAYGRPHGGHTNAYLPALAETLVAGGVPVVTLVAAAADLGDLDPYYGAQLFPIYGTTYAVLRQIVTATNTGNYGLVRALVARGPEGTTLTVRLRTRTTLVQVGGTATLTTAQWDALSDTDAITVDGRLAKVVIFQLAVVAPLLVVDYAIDWESAAAQQTGSDWAVLAMLGNAAHSVATYGGAGFPALTYGGVVQTGTDASALVQVIPTAPASITNPVVTVAWPDSDDNTTATAGQWDVVNVQWPATALGAAFARYEVERYEVATGWVPIGRVTTEGGSPHFADYEGRRGVHVLYRVRVVRTDTAVSAWVVGTEVWPVAYGCTVGLVVNGTWEGTYVSGVYQDLDELRTVQVLDQVVHRQMHAGNYQVAFRQAERRGVQWGLQLLVYSGAPSQGVGAVLAGAGLSQFDWLRRIARQEAPYVAVIDNEGGRIFASLQVPEVRRRPQGQVYYASVVATELTDVPVVHTRA